MAEKGSLYLIADEAEILETRIDLSMGTAFCIKMSHVLAAIPVIVLNLGFEKVPGMWATSRYLSNVAAWVVTVVCLLWATVRLKFPNRHSSCEPTRANHPDPQSGPRPAGGAGYRYS